MARLTFAEKILREIERAHPRQFPHKQEMVRREWLASERQFIHVLMNARADAKSNWVIDQAIANTLTLSRNYVRTLIQVIRMIRQMREDGVSDERIEELFGNLGTL